MSGKGNYYKQGSVEPIEESPLTVTKLERRRVLTDNSQRLVIVLVGLPGRGKSFIGRKLYQFLTWRGMDCKVFNVGHYRRAAVEKLSGESSSDGACDADFFNTKNESANKLRDEVARMALSHVLDWLIGDEYEAVVSSDTGSVEVMKKETNSELKKVFNSNDKFDTSAAQDCFFQIPKEKIAIFDATNSTQERRNMIIEELTPALSGAGMPTGIVFVESICDDEELLEANFKYKVSISPDYAHMSQEEAIADLRKRVRNYEEKYETITDDSTSYIKVFNLSSKLLANQIYGRMSKIVVPALMAWNIGTRPIFLCRAGKTLDEDGSATTPSKGNEQSKKRIFLRGANLGLDGARFRDALRNYVESAGLEWMRKRSEMFSVSLRTGTSISGGQSLDKVGDSALTFPCKIMASTMPRSWQTVLWDGLSPQDVTVCSNLNPLDKGDFAGMELDEVEQDHSQWHEKFEKNPYNTRFPGGECYRDLVNRLESVIIDLEQHVAPCLVVSHISVIQVLLSYFRSSPIRKCTSIEVPLHTVIKLTPMRGGGWSEEHIELHFDKETGEMKERVLPVKVSNHTIWTDQVTQT